ncbi:MAG: outer membrane beta-barrel protein [Chitinophagaceae bacterium]
MKRIALILLTVASAMQLIAQPPDMKPGNTIANGHIYGKLVDSHGKSVSDASVMLLESKKDSSSGKVKDVLLKGASTKKNGEFSFENIPLNRLVKLSITAIGFQPAEQTVSFVNEPGRAPSFEKNLGTIIMTTQAVELQNLTIKSSAPSMKLDIDKKIFNVEKNIVSAGGTAVDVMKNVPSVNVDIDGNVSLRNSSPQILVDGRPTTLTLEQIPADAIESVEVMTNPSAKFDASGGGAGILNIVLKKNKKTGYNGNIRAGVNKYGETNLSADFNARQNKFNFSGGLNYRMNNGRSFGTTDRTNLLSTPVTSLSQVNTDKNTGGGVFGRAGLDYFMTNKTTFSLSGVGINDKRKGLSIMDINTDSLFSTGTTSSYSQRITDAERSFKGGGIVFGMKHLFTKPSEELTVDANYFTGSMSNQSIYNTDNYAAGKASSIDNSMLQKIVGSSRDKNLFLQSDYVNPLTPNLKLETGVRAAIRNRTVTNSNYTFDNNTNDYTLLPSAAGNYKSSDNVYAVYAAISSQLKNFGYKLGLRAERSNYSGELTDNGQKFTNSYPISLFPSVFVSQKLRNNRDLQLSYTRRVNRPNFFQLIPFIDSSDKLNIRQGNPNLVPEFTQSVELSYMKRFTANNTFLASVYYKHNNNLITQYIDEQTDANGNAILVNTFANANSGYSTGLELTAQNAITKWWDVSSNVNFYNSAINTDNLTGTSQKDRWSWFGKVNNSFKLPANFSLQLTGMYQSKANIAASSSSSQQQPPGPPGMQAQSTSHGYIRAFFAVDFAIKKKFFNKKITTTLSVNDIFKTRKQEQYSSSDYFVQTYSRLRDPQMIRLNLAFNFGKIDATLFKRKSKGTGESVDQ